MNNIDINKENGLKTIRKLYSAVNELIDILDKDVNKGGYKKEILEKKIQAYINYFGDTKEWEELSKGKDNDKDKDLLFDKVQDDVSDIVSLSLSKEDADNARKALRQLSDVTSADVMDVLKSCIDEGGKVGKYTRYAKKKLIMNSVPSIYEKEETNNGTELYYNVVHGRYQILHGDKIYTTKRGGVEKMQEPAEINKTKKVEGATEQPKEIDEEQPKENLEGGVEWSEENIIEELKKFKNMEGYEELKRCNDVEFYFLAQQLSPKAIDLLKKLSILKDNEGNKEKLNLEFKSMLDELLARLTVNAKYFDEGAKMLVGRNETFELIKSNFSKELGMSCGDINNIKNISEYMTFICCINNIKNSVIEANKKIKGSGKGSLMYLLKGKDDLKIYSDIRGYFVKLLCKKIEEFEKLKEKESSQKMEELKDKIELDFSLLISKNSEGEYVLSSSIEREIAHLVTHKNPKDINGLVDLLLPVFIKMGMFAKNNSRFAHHWLDYIDINNFIYEEKNSGGSETYPIIKYVINGKTIELSIPKLKDFEYQDTNLMHYYYYFKHVVLYAIYKTIKENSNCPYEVEIEEDENSKPSFLVYDVYTKGSQFFEDSHYGKCLEGVFGKEGDIDTQFNSGDAGECIMEQGNGTEGSGEVSGTKMDVEEGKGKSEPFVENNIEPIEKINLEGDGENGKVEDIKVSGGKKKKRKNKENKAFEGKENAENVTIEDIINFYVNNGMERERLKSLKKNGSGDQRNCPKLREDYRIKISKSGFKKGISLGLGDIANMICKKTGNKINKPYSEPGFKAIFAELENLITKVGTEIK